MHEQTKAQSSLEFTLLVGFLMLAFTTFFIIIQGNLHDEIEEQETMNLEEIGLGIQNEIALASNAVDGYSRKFNLPGLIGGQNFSATIIDNLVFVQNHDGTKTITYPIQNVTGTLQRYENVIRNDHGIIKLNQ